MVTQRPIKILSDSNKTPQHTKTVTPINSNYTMYRKVENG